jgi:hypothetical protein
MYDVTTLWVYTKAENVKVGEFDIIEGDERSTMRRYNRAFAEWCKENGLIAKQHNFIVGAVRMVNAAVTG